MNQHHGIAALVSALCIVLAGATGVAVPAPASPGPQLSIAIGDGHATAAVGSRLTYTITVQNLGSTDLTGLVVTQSMPAGMELESADSSGGARAGGVVWNVSLKATATAVLHSTMTVYDTPPDLLRLASVACASTTEGQRPIVCATHSDQLPAGAAAPTTTGSAGTHGGWWYFVIGCAMLGIATLMALLLRRHGTRQSG